MINPILLFLAAYNGRVPNWKKITPAILEKDKNLDRVIKSLGRFIQKNDLDPKRLVDAVIDYYYKKNKRYPTIFLFSDHEALSLYKDYELAHNIDLTEEQKIRISVKKSKILVKNLQVFGIIIGEAIRSLSTTGKGDPYFLLAYGLREGVPEKHLELWDRDDVIKKIVLDEIFLDK